VFSWSFRALSAETARMFRLLSAHPGPDLTAAAAAAATGIDLQQARRSLAELARASLLTEQAPGRFMFHDLLRAYAADLADAEDGRDGLAAARRRVLDYYLHTAYAGHRLINPIQDPIALAAAAPRANPEYPEDGGAAMAWFVAEHAVLLSAVHQAAAHGLEDHCWQLAWAITDNLHRRGHWHDLLGCWQTVSDAVRAHKDEAVRVRVHRRLALAYSLIERFEEAHALLDEVQILCQEMDDYAGQGHLLQLRGYMLRRQGRLEEAITCNRDALELYRAVGHEGGQAVALNSIGWHHALVDEDYTKALSYCEEALALAQATGDRAGQGATLDSLGYIRLRLGQHELAIDHYQHSVELSRELSFRSGEAASLANLGDAQSVAGDGKAAWNSWQRALKIFDDLNHPDADRIRAKLDGNAHGTNDVPLASGVTPTGPACTLIKSAIDFGLKLAPHLRTGHEWIGHQGGAGGNVRFLPPRPHRPPNPPSAPSSPGTTNSPSASWPPGLARNLPGRHQPRRRAPSLRFNL